MNIELEKLEDEKWYMKTYTNGAKLFGLGKFFKQYIPIMEEESRKFENYLMWGKPTNNDNT